MCFRGAEYGLHCNSKQQFEAPDFLKHLPKMNHFFLNRTKRHYRSSR